MKIKVIILIYVVFAIAVSSIFSDCKNYPRKTNIAYKKSASKSYFLFLSDVHLDLAQTDSNLNEDTGPALWNSCKVKLDSILSSPNPPSFVLYTGDLPAHYAKDKSHSYYLSPTMREQHNKNTAALLNDLRQLVVKKGIPLFYVPGNNDSMAGDYFSFADENKQTPFSLIDETVAPFPVVIGATNNVAKIVSMPNPTMGYYSATAIKGLRIIGLNSIIFGNTYSPIDSVSQIDAGNTEMKWLADQLKDAKENGDKVYLAMHIPPGTDAYRFEKKDLITAMWTSKQSWLNDFLKLNQQYQTTISGIFFGHTHLDELRLLYDSTGSTITQVAISSPAVAPGHGNNPAFKTVEFDSSDKRITDFTTYYSNKKAAIWGNGTYLFSDMFNCKGTSILNCLQQKTFEEINRRMDAIYTSMNGKPSYKTGSGIVVKWVK